MNKTRKLSFYVTLCDFLTLILSYLVGSVLYLMLFTNNKEFLKDNLFQTLALFLIAFLLSETLTNKKNRLFLERTKLQEFFNVTKLSTIIGVLFASITFVTKLSFDVSRGVFFMTLIMNTLLGYILRSVMKYMLNKNIGSFKAKMIIVTTFDKANDSTWLDELCNGSLSEVIGFAILDKNIVGETIGDFKVVANVDTVVPFVKNEIVDSALVILNNGWWEKAEEMVSDFQSMGVVVHLGVDLLSTYSDLHRSINYIGNYPVLSVAEVSHSEEQLIAKRILDIIGGLVGSIITLFVAIILGPIIKLESPGPVLFKQKRVGKNGRYFYIYKFRSMGVDAEQRKKDLMSQNEVDGHMFKMTNDPRVTKVGKFIRATSIDELPQFFNVLKGDMSLVGTRPPTVEEFKAYETHHKRRLSMKPGITGMWQVSGRSDITDFEEVVRLDTQYIDKYTLALDFKILAKTFIVVFAKIGSR